MGGKRAKKPLQVKERISRGGGEKKLQRDVDEAKRVGMFD